MLFITELCRAPLPPANLPAVKQRCVHSFYFCSSPGQFPALCRGLGQAVSPESPGEAQPGVSVAASLIAALCPYGIATSRALNDFLCVFAGLWCRFFHMPLDSVRAQQSQLSDLGASPCSAFVSLTLDSLPFPIAFVAGMSPGWIGNPRTPEVSPRRPSEEEPARLWEKLWKVKNIESQERRSRFCSCHSQKRHCTDGAESCKVWEEQPCAVHFCFSAITSTEAQRFH